jgi:hypothetical protein
MMRIVRTELRTERKFPLRLTPGKWVAIVGPEGVLFECPEDFHKTAVKEDQSDPDKNESSESQEQTTEEENKAIPLALAPVGRFETDDVLFIKSRHYRTVIYDLSALPEKAN